MPSLTRFRRAPAFAIAALLAWATPEALAASPAGDIAYAQAPDPPAPAPLPKQREDSPPAPKPDEPAAAAVERCRSADFAAERRCYLAAVEERLANGGAAPALALLDRLAALDPDVRREGHMYAHHLGISALKSPEDVGRVFESCTPAWQSGCYHGVIQGYFLLLEKAGGGVTKESVAAVCGDHRKPEKGWLLFQCTHGLGHGLTMLHGHDLPKALASCNLLASAAEQEMCWAGAFMENIVNFTHPHGAGEAAAEPAAAGKAQEEAQGGHRHEAKADAAPAPRYRALDPADLHYPCSAMDSKYLTACYTIQTSAMLHHTQRDVGRVAGECGRAPEKARATCFLSLGRDVSTVALGDMAEAVRLCGLAEAAFRPVCHRGVAESIANMNAEPAEGIPYCRAVAETESKRACYAALGLQALVLPDGEARRVRACKAAEADFLNACLGRAEEAEEKPEGGK